MANPRSRDDPWWWRPEERAKAWPEERKLCLWCGTSFPFPVLGPDEVAQACEREECRSKQAAHEVELATAAPARAHVVVGGEEKRALYDVDEVSDSRKAERLRRAIQRHGVETVRAEAYL